MPGVLYIEMCAVCLRTMNMKFIFLEPSNYSFRLGVGIYTSARSVQYSTRQDTTASTATSKIVVCAEGVCMEHLGLMTAWIGRRSTISAQYYTVQPPGSAHFHPGTLHPFH